LDIAEMAVRLSKSMGSTPAFWMRLQMIFDLAQVEARADIIIVNQVIQPHPALGGQSRFREKIGKIKLPKPIFKVVRKAGKEQERNQE
jgi:hypothetical protein